MNPQEVADMEFPVVMRGYAREDVQAFLAAVADELADREVQVERLEAALASLRQQPASAPPSPVTAAATVDRGVLLRHLGEEAASILACADSAAERIKANAVTTTERVRHDLRAIGGSLVDVHQLLGELVSLVQGLSENSGFTPGGAELRIPETETSTGATTADGSPTEVRTVLGEVLGLDPATSSPEIHLPDESEVSGGSSSG